MDTRTGNTLPLRVAAAPVAPSPGPRRGSAIPSPASQGHDPAEVHEPFFPAFGAGCSPSSQLPALSSLPALLQSLGHTSWPPSWAPLPLPTSHPLHVDHPSLPSLELLLHAGTPHLWLWPEHTHTPHRAPHHLLSDPLLGVLGTSLAPHPDPPSSLLNFPALHRAPLIPTTDTY